MPLTAEEIAEARQGLSEGKAITEIAALAGLDEFTIRTAQQEQDFQTNLIQSKLEPAMKTEVGKIYSGLDADILASSGIEKASTEEKTYDYLKRVVGNMKTKVDGAAQREQELLGKIESGEGASELQTKLDTMTTSHPCSL